jgi:L-threonylcarbamoyladenylate synthase
MEIISDPTQDEIKKAAKVLKDGHLVAFPTETVYGLGADATNEKAVSRIYSVKGRPTDHPLIVHIASINQLDKWAIDIPEYAMTLAREFWPGPMTLILKRTELARDFITGGQDSVGLRVPDQSVALELLNEFEKLGGFGIAAPSANKFGAVSPTTAEAVGEELGNFLSTKDLILDGGQSDVGVESSIIDCTKDQPAILRPGAVTYKMAKELVGDIQNENSTQIRVSGQFKSHYSPKAIILLDKKPEPGDGFIALVEVSTPTGVIRLASPSNIDMFARDLYAALRLGDKQDLSRIVVYTPKGGGISAAIRDRLERAGTKFN